MDLTKPVYLGDGLFAGFDGWQCVLYASDGVNRTNTVYLEPIVLMSFLNYVSELKQAMAEPRPCVSVEAPQIVITHWKPEE